MLLLRDLPKYETLLAYSERYPDAKPSSVEAYLNLLRVASDVLDEVEKLFAAHGTSQGRFTVLVLLNRTADVPLNPADLARRAGVTRATMTGLLQGLENEKLIQREDSDSDGRMFFVRLTRKGKKYVSDVLPSLFRGIKELMSVLSEEERGTLLGLLEKIGNKVPEMFPAAKRNGRRVSF